mmetsp:Transcript_132957/g.242108  ORF Transcript_132957/g.242108 Transcript_132957/m.242108 type:complete len:311 (+) Transcript_132957:2-934(+)
MDVELRDELASRASDIAATLRAELQADVQARVAAAEQYAIDSLKHSFGDGVQTALNDVALQVQKLQTAAVTSSSLAERVANLEKQLTDTSCLVTSLATRALEGKQSDAVEDKMYSPAGHVLMNSIAAAKKSKNNMQGALQAYEYGHHILERIGTLETEHGMSILINIGLAKKRLRDIQGAHEAYIAARSICQKINATHTPEATKLANLLADLESQMSSKCEGKGHAKGTVAGKFYAGKGCKGKGRSNAGMGQASHQTCGSKGQGKAEKGAQGSTGEFGRAYYGSKGNANTTQGGKGYKGKGKGNSLNVPQ